MPMQGLPRQRGHDADGHGPHVHGQIVGQVGHPADLDPGGRLVLVHGDDRTGGHFDHLAGHVEIGQLLLDKTRVGHQAVPGHASPALFRNVQQVRGGQPVGPVRRGELERLLLGLGLLGLGGRLFLDPGRLPVLLPGQHLLEAPRPFGLLPPPGPGLVQPPLARRSPPAQGRHGPNQRKSSGQIQRDQRHRGYDSTPRRPG